jgi:asparagine synthase (glutamine-hydrolysing)
MAHSLEVRAPFLDPRLIELTRRIPFSVKMRGGRTKAILKHSLERYFPVDFVHRPKKGFAVPLNHWFRGDLTGHARALLVQPGSMTGRLFREGVVAELLALHEGGRRNAGPALWALIVFEAWCRVHEIGAEALPLEDALAGSEV